MDQLVTFVRKSHVVYLLLVTFVRNSHVVYLNSQSDNLYIKQLHLCQLDLRWNQQLYITPLQILLR